MGFNYFKSGSWRVICDVCGRKLHSDQLRKRWDNLMVCDADWEPRHEMDFLRSPPGPRAIPWARPENPDVFIGPTYVADSVGNQVTAVPAGTYTPEEPSL